MEIALLGVALIELAFDRDAADVTVLQYAIRIILKAAMHFVNESAYQGLTSLDHHDEPMAVLIQIFDVVPTEIAAVQDEPNIGVIKGSGLVDEELELADVIDRAWILLVKQRHLVAGVEGHRQVEDACTDIGLGLTEFEQINVSGLTVFIGGVVRDVDGLIVLALGVPVIKKADDLVLSHTGEKCRER